MYARHAPNIRPTHGYLRVHANADAGPTLRR